MGRLVPTVVLGLVFFGATHIAMAAAREPRVALVIGIGSRAQAEFGTSVAAN